MDARRHLVSGAVRKPSSFRACSATVEVAMIGGLLAGARMWPGITRGLRVLDRIRDDPGLSVFLREQVVGFRIVNELLLLRIEVQDATNAVGDLAQMDQPA